MSNRSAEIFIIGAGISGITAAAQLITHGFANVTILEAENRIGGRIDSVRFSDGFIDYGAQWCSGEIGNSVYELCRKEFDFGLTGFEEFDDFVAITSDGSEVDAKQLEKLHLLRMELEQLTDEMKLSTESAGVFFEERYFKALSTPKFSDIDEHLRDMFLELWQRQTNAIFASSSWYDLSAQGFSTNVLCEGRQDMTWKKSGYKTLFDIALKQFSGSTKSTDIRQKVLLNKKVTNIKWKSEKCIITTADQSTYNADHVIVTIPLGVLQAHHKTLFSPKLPDKKVSAIENMKMGTLNKVFLEFEEPFWLKDFKLCSLLWTKEDKKEIIGTDKEW